ncbi:hypothetical protein GE061_002554 [Apolygus lucorum]|uniref:Choline/ethanolamine kinase n=1 Tax=Apolygus lucorum TaxID=248454 RepID=A0A8S9X6T9_APOLU|nr:hypothetical protein GE061_002554 [Apolygus lucorum]
MGIKENMLNGGDVEMLESAVRICRGYLQGAWKRITPQDVTVKRLSGGLSNILYHVELNSPEDATRPKQVLLRLYGQTHGEGALENLITESVIFTLLSERKIGPKLFGIFPGGRIEEYLPASPLKPEEMSDPELNPLVAEKVAAVHCMNVPINKEPRWIWDTIQRWLNTIEDTTPSNNPIEQELLTHDLQGELDWLKSHLSKVPSPVVFCHNDLQQGNILRHNASRDQIVIIDFEYCAYNYRGFDLANHFMEWTYDYTKPEFPYFGIHKDRYSSPQQMKKFIEVYLQALIANGNVVKPELNNVKSIMKEIKHYTLATHLLWSVWAIVQARVSKITFGYCEFAQERLTCYYKLKNEILAGSKEQICAVKRKVIELD